MFICAYILKFQLGTNLRLSSDMQGFVIIRDEEPIISRIQALAPKFLWDVQLHFLENHQRKMEPVLFCRKKFWAIAWGSFARALVVERQMSNLYQFFGVSFAFLEYTFDLKKYYILSSRMFSMFPLCNYRNFSWFTTIFSYSSWLTLNCMEVEGPRVMYFSMRRSNDGIWGISISLIFV